jgi:hypothetical protein
VVALTAVDGLLFSQAGSRRFVRRKAESVNNNKNKCDVLMTQIRVVFVLPCWVWSTASSRLYHPQ